MSFFGSFFAKAGRGTGAPYSVLQVDAVYYADRLFAESAQGPYQATALLYDNISGVRPVGNAIEVYSGNDWPIVALLKKAPLPNTAPVFADVSAALRIGYALVHVQSKKTVVDLQLSDPDAPGADWATGLVACPFTRALTAVVADGSYALEIVVEMPSSATTVQTTWARIPVTVSKSIAALP